MFRTISEFMCMYLYMIALGIVLVVGEFEIWKRDKEDKSNAEKKDIPEDM